MGGDDIFREGGRCRERHEAFGTMVAAVGGCRSEGGGDAQIASYMDRS